MVLLSSDIVPAAMDSAVHAKRPDVWRKHELKMKAKYLDSAPILSGDACYEFGLIRRVAELKSLSAVNTTKAAFRTEESFIKNNLDVFTGLDMLSNASIPAEANREEEVDMTDVVQAISVEEYLPISEKYVKKLQEATKNDPTIQEIKKLLQRGWSSVNKNSLAPDVKIFYGLRDYLSEKEGILFYKDRLVIPNELQLAMTKMVHNSAHLGIQKTLSRARQLMYWPKMSSQVSDFVNACRTCQTYQTNNVKEPLIPSEIPSFPFQKIGTAIGEHKSRFFLMIESL